MRSQLRQAMDEFLLSGCLLSAQGSQECWVGWGKSIKQSKPTGGSRNLQLYAPDFFLKDSQPWREFSQYCRITREELVAYLDQAGYSTRIHSDAASIVWKDPDFESFQLIFDRLMGLFQSGKLRKAVPFLLVEGKSQGEIHQSLQGRAALLSQLLQSTRGYPLFVYGAWDENEGILGATPEILFEQESANELRTVALAGTRKIQVAESLLNDPKETEEHRIVLEGILDSLSGLGTLQVGQTHEVELPSLVHLKTPLTLTFEKGKEEGFESIVRRLHPTPALGAFPRKEGLEWLENDSLNQVLNQKRKRFGAPFGMMSPTGERLCVVAIRNLQWERSEFTLGVGCGIVPASRFQKECDELRAKMASVRRSFGL